MRNRIAGKIVIVLLISALIISCNDVFYSGVAGTVRDKDTGAGIEGMNVYAYSSEADWNKAYSSYQEGTIFSDNSCLFRATTSADGGFNISKVVWTTNSPVWGKDYDSSQLYFIFFNEDYGISKEGPVVLISGASNQNAITVELEKKLQSSKVVLNFVDLSSLGGNQLISDSASFTYSYNNGYRTITQNATAENGSAEIFIEYPKNTKCSLTVSNVKDPQNCFKYVPAADSKHVFEIEDTTEIEQVTMRRTAFFLKDNAIHGELLIPVNAAAMSAISGMNVYAKIGDNTYTVNLSDPVFVGGDEYVRYTYSGLASNVLIPVVSFISGYGFENIKIDVYVSSGPDTTGTYNGTLILSNSSSSLKCNLK